MTYQRYIFQNHTNGRNDIAHIGALLQEAQVLRKVDFPQDVKGEILHPLHRVDRPAAPVGNLPQARDELGDALVREALEARDRIHGKGPGGPPLEAHVVVVGLGGEERG